MADDNIPEQTATCEFQWFDKTGRLTSDDNPSVGRVRVKEGDYQLRNPEIIRFRGGDMMHFMPSRWFHICAEHAKWLSAGRLPNTDLWEWEAKPMTLPSDIELRLDIMLREC